LAEDSVPDLDLDPKLFGLKDPVLDLKLSISDLELDTHLFHTKLKNMFLKGTKKSANLT